MSIVAACPHCESRFHLQPDLIGKAMRCPNPDCREPFVVEEAKPKAKKEPPKPPYQSGTVGEVVPVVEAEIVSPGRPKPRPPKLVANVSPDLPPLFEDAEESGVVEAEVIAPPPPKPGPRAKPATPKVVEAEVIAPPPAREVVWTPDAEVPATTPKTKTADDVVVLDEPEPDEVDVLLRRRKKKSNRGPMILIGMLIAIVLAGGGIVAYVVKTGEKIEETEAGEAEELYGKGDYGPASKKYEELASRNPNGPNAEKFRFFADLASMRQAVASVTSHDDPRIAMDRMKGFIGAYKDSPFARPDGEHFGVDIFAAGRKVLEDVRKYADDRRAAYATDKRTKQDELQKAESMLTLGLEFVLQLKDFRDKEAKSLEELREPLNQAQAAIVKERRRLEALALGRIMVEVPTDEAIQNAKLHFIAAGLATDDEATEIIRIAEDNFLKAIHFEREPANPQPAPATAASLLFVAKVGDIKPSLRGPDELPAVFLAVARGILYALDEDTGNLLWAARVGPDVTEPPTIVQVLLPEGPTNLALVASNVAGRPLLTAYVLRTGQPKWSQELKPRLPLGADEAKMPPSPAAGAVVVIGTKAYVPIRDTSGSVLVFDIATGLKIGRITVGQAVGPGAFVRPGTAHLYVAADSRRLFVFDVEPLASGSEPRCLRVLPTDHPTGTLRTVPIILGQPGEDPSPRFLILSQADGASTMKFRVFPLPPTPILAPDAPPMLEPMPPSVDLSLDGWAWFPPVSDGERLTVVTDRNQFRLFGINQPGNKDTALFPLPNPTIPAPANGRPIRGLVVPAEEGAYWVLVGGSLLKYRLTLVPSTGLTLVPVGDGLPIGEPTQPAQLNPRRDTAFFVVRSANSSGFRAVAVKLRDGEPRWQRQLGIIPSSTPLRTDAGVLLVDGDAGAVVVPAGANGPASPDWIAAPPLDGVTRPTVLAASADGKTAFTLAAIGSGPIAKWVIRRAVDGKFDHSGSVLAPAALAGTPAVVNGTLLIPAADGFIYRLVMGDGRGVEDKLAPGPKWLLNRTAENPVCFITALSNELFLTSDGGRSIKRWNWPPNAGWVDDSASWTLRDRVAAAPLVLPATGGKPARLLAADETGGVTLFGLDRSDNVLRRWVPGVTAALPSGRVSAQFGFQTDPAGRLLAAYTVNGRRLVCLDVDADEPRWIVSTNEDAGALLVGSPLPAGDGTWLVTNLNGRIELLSAETGRPAASRELGLPGAVPETAGVFLDGRRVIVPLSDGSAAVVQFDEKK